MKSRIAQRIARAALALWICWNVGEETGPWSAVALLLIYIGSEVCVWTIGLLFQMMRQVTETHESLLSMLEASERARGAEILERWASKFSGRNPELSDRS